MNSALARILDYFQTHPAPTMRELVRAGLASSTSTARARCERLVALGLLAEAEPGTARRYRLAASPLHTAARQGDTMNDLEIERILAMSDDEILADVRAQGLDPDDLARDMAQQFNVIADLVRKNEKLAALLGASWTRNVAHSRDNQRLRDSARLLIERAEVRGGDVVIPRAAYEAMKELV